uniref:V-SNARE coiled-coil homology domain-containing protein n=1 Tax=Spermophilus dauricus TaxID=99837 RepID=A0A8C9URH0_SPEDA
MSTAATGNNQRIQQTQNQIDDIVDIMTVNVDKMLERDLKLSELGDPADALQMGAFPSATSAALKEKILVEELQDTVMLYTLIIYVYHKNI